MFKTKVIDIFETSNFVPQNIFRFLYILAEKLGLWFL